MNFTQLGKYKISEAIGSGAFAMVYRATDTHLGREVALKVLHPHLVDSTVAGRFQREGRTLAQLRHPAIVTVFDVGQERGKYFIAMELADGPDLGRRLNESGPLSWGQALALLRPLCAALDEAHRQGISHGDVKPGNILLDSKRGPLLADFGLARLLQGEGTSLSLSKEASGGTAAYVAPEVWQGQAVDGPAADIYALGCLVPELLTGQRLFAGDNVWAVIAAQQSGPQFPARWPSSIPEGLDEVLYRALAHTPTERYPSAGVFFEALEQLAPPASQTSKVSETFEISSIRPVLWPLLAAVALLLCGLTAVGAVWPGAAWFTPAALPTPATFLYQMRVQDQHTGRPVANASLILEVGGQLPFTVISDSDGVAALSLPIDFGDQPGRLYVEAPGYQRVSRNIGLSRDSLPDIIQLQPE